jgi:pimeloyl-ACP methyl ester carboxylesterase
LIYACLKYDVWVGNNRGNKYTALKDAENRAFWNFSFQEMGEFDLQTQVDTILEKTKSDTLTYVGHSQGSTQMFYALAKNVESFKGDKLLKDQIKGFIALAPTLTFLPSTEHPAIEFFKNTPAEKLR